MDESRLIDANAVEKEVEESLCANPHTGIMAQAMHTHEHKHFLCMISHQPTIDPETLPIVRELREELDAVTAERDELAVLCGKLIALCDQPKEWRAKLFRRNQGPMIGDYMGSGYPFVDSFNRIYVEFEETASDGAHQTIRRATDEAAAKCGAQKEG